MPKIITTVLRLDLWYFVVISWKYCKAHSICLLCLICTIEMYNSNSICYSQSVKPVITCND